MLCCGTGTDVWQGDRYSISITYNNFKYRSTTSSSTSKVCYCIVFIYCCCFLFLIYFIYVCLFCCFQFRAFIFLFLNYSLLLLTPLSSSSISNITLCADWVAWLTLILVGLVCVVIYIEYYIILDWYVLVVVSECWCRGLTWQTWDQTDKTN